MPEWLNTAPPYDVELARPEHRTQLYAVACELVSAYLGDAVDMTPDSIKNEAVARVAGYLHASTPGPVTRVQFGEQSLEWAVGMRGALRHSGAMSVLSPWKQRRGALI